MIVVVINSITICQAVIWTLLIKLIVWVYRKILIKLVIDKRLIILQIITRDLMPLTTMILKINKLQHKIILKMLCLGHPRNTIFYKAITLLYQVQVQAYLIKIYHQTEKSVLRMCLKITRECTVCKHWRDLLVWDQLPL